MPTVSSRSRDPRPNVLADEVQPNRLSTQTPVGSLGMPGRPIARNAGVSANQLMPSRPAGRSRPGSVSDTRFEARGRRAPSLATIIVLGFLLVTALRVIGALAGR